MANDSSADAQSKLNRRNRSKQIQLRKRQSLLSAISIFGGVDGAPRIVAVIPLCEDVDSHSVVSVLSTSLGLPDNIIGQESITKIKFVGSPFFLVVFYPQLASYQGWNDLKRPFNSFS